MRGSVIALIALALLGLAVTPGSLAGNHFNLNCNPVNLHPTATNLGTTPVNQPYSQLFTITPNSSPVGYYWNAVGGPTLFPGLPPVTLSPFQVFWSSNTATASGTPNQLGTFTFTLIIGAVLLEGTICFVSKTYTITVV